MTEFEHALADPAKAPPGEGMETHGRPVTDEVIKPAPGPEEACLGHAVDTVISAAKDANPEPVSKSKDAYTYSREAFDWYTEPQWCVDLLIEAEKYLGSVWDPAGGHGTIKQAFLAVNHEIRSTDITERPGAVGGRDFLAVEESPENMVDHIACNPPFSLTELFILKALRLARRSAAFLVPMKWLNSQTRYDFFAEHGRPARVYVLSNRASMPPGRYLDSDGRFNCDDPDPVRDKVTGEIVKYRWRKGDLPSGGAIDYCWVVFVPGYDGPTDMRWLAKKGGGSKALQARKAVQSSPRERARRSS